MITTDIKIAVELDDVYEEWVTHTRMHKRVSYREHSSMASQAGWWTSGWRGAGPEMKPLTPEVVTYFERIHR